MKDTGTLFLISLKQSVMQKCATGWVQGIGGFSCSSIELVLLASS